MSHHASAAALPPWITDVTPVTFASAGATTIAITGFNLSTTCRLDASTLGTVTGSTYVGIAGRTGTLTYNITIGTPPGSPAAVNLTLTNGGQDTVGSSAIVTTGSFAVTHG